MSYKPHHPAEDPLNAHAPVTRPCKRGLLQALRARVTGDAGPGKGKMRGDGTRAGEVGMEGERIPRSWIGTQVALYFQGDVTSMPIQGTLVDATPEGIAIRWMQPQETEEDREVLEFLPYGSFHRLQKL